MLGVYRFRVKITLGFCDKRLNRKKYYKSEFISDRLNNILYVVMWVAE